MALTSASTFSGSVVMTPSGGEGLRPVVPETVQVLLFADDASLISSQPNKLVAGKELRRAVTALAESSTSNKVAY